MLSLLIFGGTSEGRELAEWAQKNGFSVILCVATDYGEAECTPARGLVIRKGRMDCAQMTAFFDEQRPFMVIDATHPHAVQVSKNIREVAENAHLPLIRVVRPETASIVRDEYGEGEKDHVFYAASAAEAAELLKDDDGPVLLTTGSKELPEFSSLPDFAGRVYARVLPEFGAISACGKAGLSGSHIIAMQGPFSAELNRALIRSVGAEWLITKESGSSGGFPEKIQAAADCGIKVIVIRRPVKEEGLSLSEAEQMLLAEKEKTSEPEGEQPKPDTSITLIGLGMGGGSQLTLEALQALSAASVIFGAKRMTDDIRPYAGSTPAVPLYDAGEILSYLDEHPGYEKACVVFSGDTGFYSGCAGFLKVCPSARVLPGISAFSCLCARFGLREEEFTPASAHGKDADPAALLTRYGKIFLLLDPETGIGKVCRALTDAGYGNAVVFAGIDLGYADEELLSGKAEEFTGRKSDALAVMAVEREDVSDA